MPCDLNTLRPGANNGLGLLPCEVGVTLLPPHRVVGKMTYHVCNVLGTRLPDKSSPVNIRLLSLFLMSKERHDLSPSLLSCPRPFPAAVDFTLGLPGTKLELHVTCYNLTNDILWPLRPWAAMRLCILIPHSCLSFLPIDLSSV